MFPEEKKIMTGTLFKPLDPDLKALKRKAHKLSQDYNRLYEDQTEERGAILRELVGELGEGVFIQGPITFHYGCHTRIGKGTFINFNFTVQDDCTVTIGEHCAFGPNVTIVTPQHPLLPDERRLVLDEAGNPAHMCYAQPVTIGSDCWFGANVVVCPGVTIGDGCVIGAGSVVTRDIPAGSIAAGVPCKVIRPLTEADSMKYRPEILGGCSVMEAQGASPQCVSDSGN